MPKDVTADDVIREAQLIANAAKNRCVSDETWLHEQGYTKFHGAMVDFRTAIDKAFDKLVEELMA